MAQTQQQQTYIHQLEDFLSHADYPLTKQELLDTVEEHGGGDDLMSLLEELPEQEYFSLDEITTELEDLY